jgi:hypothetical protein
MAGERTRLLVSLKSDDEVQIPSVLEINELWDDELEPQSSASIKLKDLKKVSSESLHTQQLPTPLIADMTARWIQAQIVEIIVNSDAP